jgi:carboxylesterase
VRELMSKGWSDWEKAVHEELNALKQRCDVVFLVGHSLGGALVLHLAAHEDVAGLVSMCAPLYMYPWTEFVVRLAKGVFPLLPSLGEDLHWQIRRRYKRDVYRWMPVSSVESILRFLPHLRVELPRVTAPALVMTSITSYPLVMDVRFISCLDRRRSTLFRSAARIM